MIYSTAAAGNEFHHPVALSVFRDQQYCKSLMREHCTLFVNRFRVRARIERRASAHC